MVEAPKWKPESLRGLGFRVQGSGFRDVGFRVARLGGPSTCNSVTRDNKDYIRVLSCFIPLLQVGGPPKV